MSNYQNPHDDDIPRFEPWLGVTASAVGPVIVALYLPSIYVIPLIAVSVVLFAAGLIMLRRQTLRRARDRGEARLPSATSVRRPFDGETLEMEGAEP